ALPQQVVFAEVNTGNGNGWQLEMIGADKAHTDGHKGQGIKIGVVDDAFASGSHGELVTRVVKHVAPSASVTQHAAYQTQTTEPISYNLRGDGKFDVQLPYIINGPASFDMTFDAGDKQETTTLTIDENQQVTSSSKKFTDLKVVN